ncbi:MAG: GNAT family N-acetyltransferase [Bacillota bacterium]
MIRKAYENELNDILKIANKTKKNMLNNNLKQWIGNYPNLEVFINDLKLKGLYVYLNDSKIVASISILEENDIPYKAIKWYTHDSLVIHRILVDPIYQHKGIGKALFRKAIELSKKGNYKSLKVDTHPDNIKMQKLIKSMGFKYVGYLESINRLAYELIV